MASISLLFEPRQSAGKVLARLKDLYPFELCLRSFGPECDDVFALRYLAYLDAGLIAAEEPRRYSDAYDEKATTYQIAAYDKDRLIGAIRFSTWRQDDRASGIPCEAVYPEIQTLKQQTKGTLVEFSRLAVDPSLSNWSYRTTLYGALVRAALIAAKSLQAERVIVAARAPLNTFYERMCGFRQMAAPQLYPPGGVPVMLMAATMADIEARQNAQNAFFEIRPEEITAMRIALMKSRSALERVA